jgi:hypothetical protein
MQDQSKRCAPRILRYDYSPLWDVDGGKWTKEAVDKRYR